MDSLRVILQNLLRDFNTLRCRVLGIEKNVEILSQDLNTLENTVNNLSLGTIITVTDSYVTLPDPTTVSGQFYWCKDRDGDNLTGLYYSDGSRWNASEAEELPEVVVNYSALPDPTTVPNKFYWVSNEQGTAWLPGSLGGTYYNSGLYYSNGVAWEFLNTPIQATQLEVDTGTIGDKFVSPITLNNATIFKSITESEEQVHTTGATVTILDGIKVFYVNPTSALPSLTITLPALPLRGQEVKISFGGTITSDGIVSVLSIVGNVGHTILGNSGITTASAGDGYVFKFDTTNNLWRIF